MSAAPAVPLPRYGDAALADLMPSVAAGLGVPGYTDVLGLGRLSRVCVLLIDGLGWRLLHRYSGQAPYLSSALPGARFVTAGFPSTTAASLGSIGTGLAPGGHGILGYRLAVPGTDRLINSLRWDDGVDPYEWQPHRTVLENAAADGVAVTHAAPGAFRGSGLTVAALRGPAYAPAETAGDVVARVVAALSGDERALCLAYHADLDKIGHLRGCRSAAWRYELGQVDRLVEQLAAALPPGRTLIVTADHGMVDVDADRRLDGETEPALTDGVRAIGGEPRARYVYPLQGAADDVLAAWREVLGDRMWVLTREQAVADGWFGPAVDPAVLDRVGAVVAAAHGDVAVTASRSEPIESTLPGLHGSLTADEQLVPLVVIGGS